MFKPDPARLRRFLCALINFAKFRDEKVALYDELEAEAASKAQAEEALTQEYERNVRVGGVGREQPKLRGSTCMRALAMRDSNAQPFSNAKERGHMRACMPTS